MFRKKVQKVRQKNTLPAKKSSTAGKKGKKKLCDNLAKPCFHYGGDEGNRTLDLLNAIQALSQLSYVPNSTSEQSLLYYCQDNLSTIFENKNYFWPFSPLKG